jgi:hypothetical protein
MAARRNSMDRRPSLGRSESILPGEGRNHVVFGVPKGEYLPPYFKSMKDKVSDPYLHFAALSKDELKKKMKKDGGRYLVVCLAPEMLKAGMVEECREMAPGVPVWAYGNEPSGKYRKEIEQHLGKLDGVLDGPSILPACKGSWSIPALESMINKAKSKTGQGSSGHGGGNGGGHGGGPRELPLTTRIPIIHEPDETGSFVFACVCVCVCVCVRAHVCVCVLHHVCAHVCVSVREGDTHTERERERERERESALVR